MDKFNLIPDPNEQKPTKVTTIVGGTPTKEEYEKAMNEMYNELYFGHWSWRK